MSADMKAKLADQLWRLHNLYRVMDKDGKDVKFVPNEAQLHFLRNMWYRNVVPKGRQRGLTTITQLWMLDACLFNSNHRAGIIAHTREDSQSFFNDKVKFAYDRLPESLRTAQQIEVEKDSASQIIFGNNSSIRVGTSLRSGTFQKVHVSEFGKMCAKFPTKAAEVITGTLNAISPDSIAVIESTAEGAEGPFFEMCMAALADKLAGKKLNKLDYKLHFYTWWNAPEYVTDPDTVVISKDEHKYFDAVETKIGAEISLERRAWYIATRLTQERAKPGAMKQEHPSTVQEAFEKSMEGCYYTNQMAAMRKQSRITNVPFVASVPVNTFWDVGASDYTCIWFHQKVGLEHRFIKYYENCGEDLVHYMNYLKDTGYLLGQHFLPHDCQHERLDNQGNKSIEQMLNDLGLTNTIIVPRCNTIMSGIEETRMAFSQAYIDEAECKIGISRLDNYRKERDTRTGAWKDSPRHDENSHGADAFRQWAQAIDQAGAIHATKVPRRASSKTV